MTKEHQLNDQSPRERLLAGIMDACAEMAKRENGEDSAVTTKAVIYIRTARHDTETIRRREALLRAIASDLGIEVLRAYVDCGVSGTTDYRPALQSLLADAKRHAREHPDGSDIVRVMVTSIDQLARNIQVMAKISLELAESGYGVLNVQRTYNRMTMPTLSL